MARRLPIYLLLDISGSMNGEPITAVQNGVQMVVSALRISASSHLNQKRNKFFH